MERLRVDKWLWAARFYKTRSIAKAAIEGGKVHLDGQRVKVSREITIGERLAIKQGWALQGPLEAAIQLFCRVMGENYVKDLPH